MFGPFRLSENPRITIEGALGASVDAKPKDGNARFGANCTTFGPCYPVIQALCPAIGKAPLPCRPGPFTETGPLQLCRQLREWINYALPAAPEFSIRLSISTHSYELVAEKSVKPTPLLTGMGTCPDTKW